MVNTLNIPIQKILIISGHYYPIKGGTPTHTENLCYELSSMGYDVTLITEDRPGENKAMHDAEQPYHVIRLKAHRLFSGDAFFPFLVGRHINQYIQKIQPDIINISTGNYVPLGLKLSKKQKVPIVYTVHNVPPEEYKLSLCKNLSLNNSLKKVYFSFIRKLAQFCMVYGRYDAIISGSERTRERLIAASADPNKIDVISYGTHLPILKEKILSSSLNIVLIAGIIGHKGQLDAVHAMPHIIDKIPNAKLHLVGPIRDVAYYRQILHEIEILGLQNVVLIYGEVSSEKLEATYQMCDIYIQPSHQEGFCLAVLDALAYGLPVIGTPVGAIPEMIGENRGILIPSPNSKNIAEAVTRFATDISLAKLCGNNARKFIEGKFTWKAIAEKTVAYYQKVWENTYNTRKKYK